MKTAALQCPAASPIVAPTLPERRLKAPDPARWLNPALHWRPLAQLDPPAHVADWLTDAGSLTRRLQRHGRFSVRPVRQGIAIPRRDEAFMLGLAPRRRALIREVLLQLDGEPVVQARSVIPLASLQGANRVLGHMARRSLGSELFRRPAAARPLVWGARVPGALLVDGCDAWGRQSLFIKRGRPLLVAEVFLARHWQRLGLADWH